MHVFHQNFFYQVLLIMFRFLFSCYSHCFDILLACNISSMSHFASLPEHCQCYPREDVFPIFSLGSVREIHSLGKYFSVHSLGHSEYQEIHTFSALNIDSVKINTSLLMMREWHILRKSSCYFYAKCVISVQVYTYCVNLCAAFTQSVWLVSRFTHIA